MLIDAKMIFCRPVGRGEREKTQFFILSKSFVVHVKDASILKAQNKELALKLVSRWARIAKGKACFIDGRFSAKLHEAFFDRAIAWRALLWLAPSDLKDLIERLM